MDIKCNTNQKYIKASILQGKIFHIVYNRMCIRGIPRQPRPWVSHINTSHDFSMRWAVAASALGLWGKGVVTITANIFGRFSSNSYLSHPRWKQKESVMLGSLQWLWQRLLTTKGWGLEESLLVSREDRWRRNSHVTMWGVMFPFANGMPICEGGLTTWAKEESYYST